MDPKDEGLLILKSSPQAMKLVETYLKNREWRFASTVSLKEAIQFIIKYRPKYVMIPADHPQKKVLALPKMLTQMLKVNVVAYVEGSLPRHMNALAAMNLEWNMYPPISGPQLVRFFAKLQKDLLARAQQASSLVENAEAAASGETDTASNTTLFQNSGDATSKHGADRIVFKGEAQMINGPSSSMNESSITNALASFLSEGDDSGTSTMQSNFGPPPTPSNEDPGMMINKGAKSKPTTNTFEKADERDRGHFAGGDGSRKDKQNTPAQATPNTFDNPDLAPSEQDEPEKTLIRDSSSTQVLKKKDESIILRGAINAMDESITVSSNPTAAVENLQEASSQIACLVVQSERFSGYLVVALGANRKVDAQLTEQIREHLFKYLRARGERIKELDTKTMDLEVKPVKFQNWAHDQADFLLSSVHEANEVAMAFFPSKDVNIALEASAEEHMLKMELNDISEDTPLDFDLFIHLPSNQKYLLYGKEGRNVFGEQKGRLMEKGVTHIHLKKESESLVKKYKARSFINGLISDYQSKSRTGGKPAKK